MAPPARRALLHPLHRKLLRDLLSLRGQTVAIALVVAAGVSLLVGMFSTQQSLHASLSTYYDRYRFADVFAPLKRAPDSLAKDLERIPGVTVMATRVTTEVVLDVRGLAEPATGRILSLPDAGRPLLNDLYLRSGRLPEPGREGEVLIGEAFAVANKLQPGDTLSAVINGRWKQLAIVGVALSPEYIYQMRGGDIFPDDRRFGVLWMRRRALAAAVDMDGAFNDVAVQLAPGASRPEVIAALDRLLSRWGGVGAFGRDKQMSARFLDNELSQLRASGITVPSIFLAVAAFLLNVVLTRIIGTQRAQIATLKAFGYSSREIGWHYLQLVLAVIAVGDAVGVAAGLWIGHGMTAQYTDFFHFPVLMFSLSAISLFGSPCAISLITSCSRSLNSARPRRRWARACRATMVSALAINARSMRSTSALFENGFSTKSKAPRLTAATAVGTSPCPVRKMTGKARVRPRSVRRSNSARPLMPCMRRSSNRHDGEVGHRSGRTPASASSAASNASALAWPCDSRRRERSSQATASRTTSSSSTR